MTIMVPLSDGSQPQTQTGRGGQIILVPAIYAADKLNVIGDELTAIALKGAIASDIDRDIKTTLKLTVDDRRQVPAYSWLAIYQTIIGEDGTEDAAQRGLFQLSQPQGEADDAGGTDDIAGCDVTVILQNAAVDDTYNLASGTNIATAIRDLCASEGITRHNIADSGKLVPANGMQWKPGTAKLAICNDLAQAAGCYTLFASRDGLPTTFPYRRLADLQPAHRYTVGQDSQIVSTVKTTKDDSSFANYVIVTKDDPTQGATPIRATAINDDPRSPVSTVNIGKKSRTVSDTNLVDQAAAQALADATLEQASINIGITLEVWPALDHELHQTAYLDLSAVPHLAEFSGLWWVNTISQGLGIDDGTIQLGLKRLESAYDQLS